MKLSALSRPSRADLDDVIKALDTLIESARGMSEDDGNVSLEASDIVGVSPLADLVACCISACSGQSHESCLDAAFEAQIDGHYRSIADSELAFRALVLCGLGSWASGKDPE